MGDSGEVEGAAAGAAAAADLLGGAPVKDPSKACAYSNQWRGPEGTGRCRVRRGEHGTPMKRKTPLSLRRSSRIAAATARRPRGSSGNKPRTVAQLAVVVDALSARVDRLDGIVGTPSSASTNTTTTPPFTTAATSSSLMSSTSSEMSPGWRNLLAAAASLDKKRIPKQPVSMRRSTSKSAGRQTVRSSELDALLASSSRRSSNGMSMGGRGSHRRRRSSIRSPVRGEM